MKKIVSLVLICVMVMSLCVGCAMPKSVTEDKLTFTINDQSYNFGITLNELLEGGNVKTKQIGSTEKLSPGGTKTINCEFKASGVTNKFSVTVCNKTTGKIKLNEATIIKVHLASSGISAKTAASIMDVSLNDTNTAFEPYFGKCESQTKNTNSEVFSWKNIPIKDSNYLVTVVVTESFNDLNRNTSEIEVWISDRK